MLYQLSNTAAAYFIGKMSVGKVLLGELSSCPRNKFPFVSSLARGRRRRRRLYFDETHLNSRIVVKLSYSASKGLLYLGEEIARSSSS